jgi:hypothetical protein
MRASLTKLVSVAVAHGELETGTDLDALMGTMEGEPVYDIYPIGKRFQGWENTKRYYRHFFDVVQPAIQGFTPVSQAIGEKGVVEEYDIVVRHPGESETTTHRIIAILTFGEERLSGERMYSDDKLFKLMFAPLWDSLEPIPSV